MDGSTPDSPGGTTVPLLNTSNNMEPGTPDTTPLEADETDRYVVQDEDNAERRNIKVNGHVQSPEQDSKPNGFSHLSASTTSLLCHRVIMEEVAPSTSSIIEGRETRQDWKVSLDLFSSKKHGHPVTDKKLPRRVRRYYKRQDELITAFEEMHLEVNDELENAKKHTTICRLVFHLSKATFFINLLLLIGKSIAAGLSGSLSIISAVIDSAVDLVSGALMWWSYKAMITRDPYSYPQGRTKLEPVAIVVLSVVMALASVQMIRESVEKIIDFATKSLRGPDVGIPSIVICSCTIVIKLVLYLVCRRVANQSIQVLAQDHRNDVLSNSVALACGLLGTKVWCYADPIGAIIISIYILGSWFVTGWEQIKMLTGHTARPDFLKKITWLSLNHHPTIKLIDTVRVYHFGNNFIVEVDVVLPEELSLRESHDIGESLQLKIECLPEVERAFVHLDYECDHDPRSEHKVV